MLPIHCPVVSTHVLLVTMIFGRFQKVMYLSLTELCIPNIRHQPIIWDTLNLYKKILYRFWGISFNHTQSMFSLFLSVFRYLLHTCIKSYLDRFKQAMLRWSDMVIASWSISYTNHFLNFNRGSNSIPEPNAGPQPKPKPNPKTKLQK